MSNSSVAGSREIFLKLRWLPMTVSPSQAVAGIARLGQCLLEHGDQLRLSYALCCDDQIVVTAARSGDLNVDGDCG